MRLLIIYFTLLISLLHASVRPSVEQTVAEDLATSLGVYKRHITTQPLETWEQLALVSPGFYGLNAMLDSRSVTEIFSIVPLDKRNRFPLGNLIFVQSKAMNWPDIWKTKDPKNPDKYLNNNGHQEIRFFIYEKGGKYVAERWYETKFQAMLAETGLTIPPPTPYYPPPPTPPGEKPAAPSAQATPVVASETSPDAAPSSKPTPTTAQVTPPSAKSSNPLWWIVSAIAALAALVFLATRKKKPRA